MRLDTSGNLGIGLTTVPDLLAVYSASAARLSVYGDGQTQINAYRYSTDASAPQVGLAKYRGTYASPTAVANGDQMASINFQAYGGTNRRTLAQVTGWVDTYASDTNISSYLTFSTSSSGTVSSVERMRIDSSGNVGIGTSLPSNRLQVGDGTADTRATFRPNSAFAIGVANGAGFAGWIGGSGTADTMVFSNSGGTERMRIDSSGNVLVTNPAGLGYGTGSGGTVTQATSKSTAVTLNKPTGQITMNAAALAASTTVAFTLNNSLITTSDNIILTFQNGGASTGQSYQMWVGGSASGLIVINVRNISAGSLSEALVINFAIIKGATS